MLTERILAMLREEAGLLQRDVFRRLGEKDILVVSLLDQLAANGLIERRGEPTRLYLNGEVPTEAAVEGVGEVVADQRVENALIMLDLFRLCHRKLGLRVEVGKGLRGYRGEQKVLTAGFGPNGAEVRMLVANGEQVTSLRSTLESQGGDIENGGAEGWLRICACSRASLLEILSSMGSALTRTAEGQKKAAER